VKILPDIQQKFFLIKSSQTLIGGYVSLKLPATSTTS